MILRIKDIAKAKKMTIKSLAEKVGITQPNMSNIVNEKTMPSIQTLQNVADVLDVHISELFVNPDNSTSIICPNCGTDIFIEVRK
ncbi:MAG: helix-turn-helix transcriptional regulator [Dysgonamonadaceae bacterium]|nr:helix-turn-helix transcriptional regulator [Dysgonamonadaceae bacterium]MEA4822071.1 helix-turn-helix transcriptional regulator [Erysipelotrichales bacterium]